MSTFWSGWIIVLSGLNIIGCFWLIRWTMKKRAGESAEGDTTGHTWDDTLQEFNNPLPRWWLWLFYVTLIFAVVYLIQYPGMGNWKGVLGWTSGNTLNASADSQYANEMDKAEKKYAPIYQQYASVSVADLATDPQYSEAREMGKRLFLTYCMQCHQSDASGTRGYPNLTDHDWLWGGSPEQIVATISNGRQATMPSWAQLGDKTIDTLASWLSGDKAAAKAGEAAFLASGCVGCHGMDAKGNQALGAPNLTDNIWLYGGTKKTIEKTIRNGRHGQMPAFEKLLGNEKIHLLASYVYSLSK
jgi:cytochrome c oxidase cbb3-type subunit III